ncbi:hypothetical protein OV090_39950 [Nannocystis sp. RBIL2]|uniref:hypothetical protein n=1 Tax=Nannocystis sp. RBIL2 TaxID=2996788 RepID=UPI00226E5289|nr:hypothetical protein [Nannocystis sp. RBIL2]MCY1070983.1 hypothetical protein [Nannocystis sp. RBIL2]
MAIAAGGGLVIHAVTFTANSVCANVQLTETPATPRQTPRGTLDDTGADEVMRTKTAAMVRIMTLLHGGPLPARSRRHPMARRSSPAEFTRA